MGPWVVVGKTSSQSRTAGDKPGDNSTVTALLGPWVVVGKTASQSRTAGDKPGYFTSETALLGDSVVYTTARRNRRVAF